MIDWNALEWLEWPFPSWFQLQILGVLSLIRTCRFHYAFAAFFSWFFVFGVGLSAASMKWNDHIFAFHIEVNALLTSCRKEARKTSQDKQGKPVEKQARYQSQKFSCQHVDKYVQYVRYFDVMPVGIWKETQFKKTETTLTLAVFLFNPWILPICSVYLLFFQFSLSKGSINIWFPNLLLQWALRKVLWA